ncbi:MAG: hypothetical protein OSB73_14610 [Candidatus Latescibacteria bacterium]|nr:hypothetical protein [Candidatus Latescibacterota bacterium]
MVGFRGLGFGGGRFRHYRYRLRDRQLHTQAMRIFAARSEEEQ